MKDKFVNVFQIWLPKAENESKMAIKAFRTYKKGKFISAKLREFYKKKSIMIKYIALYIHKENDLAKYGWITVITCNDLVTGAAT